MENSFSDSYGYLTSSFGKSGSEEQAAAWMRALKFAQMTPYEFSRAVTKWIANEPKFPSISELIAHARAAKRGAQAETEQTADDALLEAASYFASSDCVLAMEVGLDGKTRYYPQRIEDCVQVGTKRVRSSKGEMVALPIYQLKINFAMDRLGARRVEDEIRKIMPRDTEDKIRSGKVKAINFTQYRELRERLVEEARRARL